MCQMSFILEKLPERKLIHTSSEIFFIQNLFPLPDRIRIPGGGGALDVFGTGHVPLDRV